MATAGTKAAMEVVMRWMCLNPIYFSSIVSAPQAGVEHADAYLNMYIAIIIHL